MSIFKGGDFVFDREQIKGISEAVFESGFAKPELNLFHKVVTGIVAKKQMAILGRLNGMVGLGDGSCDPDEETNAFGGTDKTWDPAVVSARLPQCAKDLENTFFAYALKPGVTKNDLTSTDFAVYVEELIGDLMSDAVLRNAWFGDTAAENVTDGGVITDSINPAYFTKVDGFWKQIFAIVAADATRKTAGLATKNAAATFALQAFTTTDTTNRVVSLALQNARFGADLRLRAKANKIFVCTQSVVDQYETELIDQNKSYTLENVMEGISMLKSGGITVYGFDFWDRTIQTAYSNGTKWFLPHRAVLLNPENMQIGTENTESLTELDVFYDKVSKKEFFDFQFNIDPKIAIDYEIQAIY